MEGVLEVPSYFLCPISLEIMRDPVTLSTGITYDRESIERWIFVGKNSTCPVTKQSVADGELTPNHTLRRLIQAWCAANSSLGIERFPTPRPPVDKAQISKLILEAKKPQSQMNSLRKLKAIVSESERNKRCAEAAGMVDFLVSIIKCSISSSKEAETIDAASDEAITILCSLQVTEQGLLELIRKNGDFIEILTAVMKQSSYQSRAYAMFLLKSIVSVMAPARLIGLREELFEEIVKVMHDRISYQATKAALKTLGELCARGSNRIKAANAGAVAVLIDLLLDEQERRASELELAVLDQLCRCAEGRAELVGHAAGLAVVSKKVLRVSLAATERAVRILHSVSKFSATPGVLQEMLHVGVVSKLCLVLQIDCGMKAKEKAKEMLRLHSKVWKNSLCISLQLHASYPSS